MLFSELVVGYLLDANSRLIGRSHPPCILHRWARHTLVCMPTNSQRHPCCLVCLCMCNELGNKLHRRSQDCLVRHIDCLVHCCMCQCTHKCYLGKLLDESLTMRPAHTKHTMKSEHGHKNGFPLMWHHTTFS